MEMVDGMHAGQSQVGWSNVMIYRSICQVRGDTVMTPDHAAVQLRSFF